MKDKNGKEIKVGDIVEHRTRSTGKVTGVKDDEYRADWDDGQWLDSWFFEEENIEVKSVAEQETFTEEDEELLQKLLLKKEQSTKLRDDAEKDYDDLRKALYENADCINLKEYLTENTDKICDTLQNYKKHCIK